MKEFIRVYNENDENEAKAKGIKPAKLTQRGSSSIELPPAVMVSFFKPLFDQIIDKVLELMQQARDKGAPVNFIFMVGGFSESPFLKAEIKKIFAGSIPGQPPV